jgi:hypothetical protein
MIEDHARPDDPALLVDQREAPIVNSSDDSIEARFKLRFAPQSEGVESINRPSQARIIGGSHSIFDTVAILRKRIDALSIVVLQALEVHVGSFNQFLSRSALRWRDGFKPERLRPA